MLCKWDTILELHVPSDNDTSRCTGAGAVMDMMLGHHLPIRFANSKANHPFVVGDTLSLME